LVDIRNTPVIFATARLYKIAQAPVFANYFFAGIANATIGTEPK